MRNSTINGYYKNSYVKLPEGTAMDGWFRKRIPSIMASRNAWFISWNIPSING
jgi:hypothetical protein